MGKGCGMSRYDPFRIFGWAINENLGPNVSVMVGSREVE